MKREELRGPRSPLPDQSANSLLAEPSCADLPDAVGSGLGALPRALGGYWIGPWISTWSPMIRARYATWRDDAGPWRTVPSERRNWLKCHGHSMLSPLTLPSASGPPACEHVSF